jgi:hypothetical protein
MANHRERERKKERERQPAIFMYYTGYSPTVSPVCGIWWHNWLRHCATNCKVRGSIPAT